ncbi:Hemolysin A [Streptococcus pyogenes]|nr:Hemolysin A [Streptococcus pyogenes]
MPKERVDVLAYKQGLFETREQAKRGVMAGLVVSVINGQRYDKPGDKIDDGTELKLKGEKLKYVSRGGLKLEKGCTFLVYQLLIKLGLILALQQVVLPMLCYKMGPN